MLVNNRWVRATGDLQQKPISIQYREEWEVAKESGQYPICVQIAWYAHGIDDSSGFPSADEQAQILVFHERLQSELEADDHAVIGMVIAHSGVNQWIIYAVDVSAVEAGLNRIPTEQGLYPIEVVADSDHDWNTFTQVFQAIQP